MKSLERPQANKLAEGWAKIRGWKKEVAEGGGNQHQKRQGKKSKRIVYRGCSPTRALKHEKTCKRNRGKKKKNGTKKTEPLGF